MTLQCNFSVELAKEHEFLMLYHVEAFKMYIDLLDLSKTES